MTGRFISLEGVEGVGKTTNLEFIKNSITDAGKQLLVTREPGGTEVGEKLRDLLLHSREQIDATTELLMMAASRSQHILEVIQPALAKGTWVLSDRFTDASYAYQGGGRELGADAVRRVHEAVNATLEPDLTLLLDMPVADGLERASSRSTPDRIEQEEASFFDRARDAYLMRAAENPARIKIINASKSLEEVQSDIALHLQGLLNG